MRAVRIKPRLPREVAQGVGRTAPGRCAATAATAAATAVAAAELLQRLLQLAMRLLQLAMRSSVARAGRSRAPDPHVGRLALQDRDGDGKGRGGFHCGGCGSR